VAGCGLDSFGSVQGFVVGFCDHGNEHAVPYLASRAIISFLRTAVFSFAGLCMCVYIVPDPVR
jgi:hypothetical protein